MKQKKEVEIIDHSIMNHLKVFLVDMTSRAPHGHDDMEIGVILDGFWLFRFRMPFTQRLTQDCIISGPAAMSSGMEPVCFTNPCSRS